MPGRKCGKGEAELFDRCVTKSEGVPLARGRKKCLPGYRRNPLTRHRCIKNPALEKERLSSSGQKRRQKIEKVRSTRPKEPVLSPVESSLHFTRESDNASCTMNYDDIRILWRLLFFKEENAANICRALEESLILPSRPLYVISSGAYGTSVLLQSGKVAKVVPVSRRYSDDEIGEIERRDGSTITPLEEAQYEAYMMHYVSKHNITKAPKLYQFNVIEPHERQQNSLLYHWVKHQPSSDIPLNTLPFKEDHNLQLAVFIMSRAEGKTVNSFLEKMQSNGHISTELLDECAKLVADCLSMISEFHNKGVVHGDCHSNNILYNQERGTVTFIDWARGMRRDDFVNDGVSNPFPTPAWRMMCTYDFAQFLYSVLHAVGPICYSAILGEISEKQLLDESFGVHRILSEKWITNPGEKFKKLIKNMFSSLDAVQDNARRVEAEKSTT